MLRLKVFIAQILISPFRELIKSGQQSHPALCQKVFDMGRDLIELLSANHPDPLQFTQGIVFQIPIGFVRTLVPNISKMFFLLNDTENLEPIQKEKINRLKATLKEMQQMNDAWPGGYLLRFNSLLYDAILQLYQGFSMEIVQADFDHKSQVLARLTPILNYTAQHYNEPISIQDIADVAAFQPTYFCRFSKNIWVSPFWSIKMNSACPISSGIYFQRKTVFLIFWSITALQITSCFAGCFISTSTLPRFSFAETSELLPILNWEDGVIKDERVT